MECNGMKDLDEILGMAKNVQAELEKAQANLDRIEVEGISGGGLVRVRATAKGRITGVSIDESLLAPSEKQMTEDLVAAAFNDARTKADQASQQEMSKMTSGIPLPPGFKLPF
jgi:nucleoid-associated protein EbfC